MSMDIDMDMKMNMNMNMNMNMDMNRDIFEGKILDIVHRIVPVWGSPDIRTDLQKC
jgi:hypothetical protein